MGFVYALNAKASAGNISAYTIDSVSGAITQVANSPFDSGGQYPVADAVSNNSKYLYVVNEADNFVVQFNIGTDGKLYKNASYNTPGTYPIAVAIDPSSKYLFVVDSYAPGFNGVAPPNLNPLGTNTVPTQGCIVVYPISQTNGTLGTPVSSGGQSCFQSEPRSSAPNRSGLPRLHSSIISMSPTRVPARSTVIPWTTPTAS